MNIFTYQMYSSIPMENVAYSSLPDDIENKEYVVIDDDIAYIIQTLNKKGYKTRFCCSGHFGEDNPSVKQKVYDGYIFFMDAHNFKNLPKQVVQETPNIIRFMLKTEPNTSDRFYELNDIIYCLSRWADSLEAL